MRGARLRGWASGRWALWLLLGLSAGGCVEAVPASDFAFANKQAKQGVDGQASNDATGDVATGDVAMGDVADVADAGATDANDPDAVATADIDDAAEADTPGADAVDPVDAIDAGDASDASDASICTANAKGCQNGQQASCKPDGSGWVLTPCPSGQGCDGDACKTQVCTPNAVSCIGNVIAICTAGGTANKPGQDCETSGLLCKDGACVGVQKGFAARGAFVTVGSSAGGGYVVRQQGFVLRKMCGQGFCAQGGLRP